MNWSSILKSIATLLNASKKLNPNFNSINLKQSPPPNKKSLKQISPLVPKKNPNEGSSSSLKGDRIVELNEIIKRNRHEIVIP